MQKLARKPSHAKLKRLLDLIGASIALLIALIPMLIIACTLRVKRVPVLFVHERVGHNGKRFPCYKFSTMYPDATLRLAELLDRDPMARAEWERDFKLKCDPRVTPIGDFLRKTSLDELPQLWNVLVGHMSLVGPRPVIEAELSRYGDYLRDYLSVRPGITGLWQVSGRNQTTYDERVALDAHYVRNWSLWLDGVILVRTIQVVVARKGAY
jgi:undecaprenyl-phosphate galactose phosphotransferase